MATVKTGLRSDVAQSGSERLRLLEAENGGLSVPAALALAVQQAMAGVGGLSGLLHHRDVVSGELHLVAVGGLGPGFSEAWAKMPEGGRTPPARAARSGADIWSADGMGTHASGTAAVPLLGADGPIGALSVLMARPGPPDEEQWSFLASVAAWAVARAGPADGDTTSTGGSRRWPASDHLGEEPSADHFDEALIAGRPDEVQAVPCSERTFRMGELTVALAEAVTSLDVVRAVQERVLPPFGADGMLVEVIERNRLHILGSTGYSREFLEQIEGVPLTTHTAATGVLYSRTPDFVESPKELLRRYPELESLMITSAKKAWAMLPLIASGRSIGCCVVSFDRERSFSEEQRTLLTALSALVAQALERARLYDAEHARAQKLQRGLLPRTLPSLPAVSAGARYLPAGQSDEVGGDWYDVIPLSSDRVALVVGDVMGHGLAEAVTMARLRTAVRTLADLGIPPDELLAHLGDLIRDLGDDSYATCLYAEYDPVTRICAFSTAGHPPPIVVRPDGTVVRPEPAADPPLGAADPPFGTHELHLPEGSLLVFCTDGLVESATRDIYEGLDQLGRSVSRAATGSSRPSSGSLDELCDTVVSDLLPDREHTDDDAVLFVARTRSTPDRDVASFSLSDGPQAAGEARRHVREQLALWDLSDLEVTTELVVSELVGNVVRHASGPVRLRLLRSRTLICEVYDSSPTTPRIRRATSTDEGGRGLQLVAAVSQRWGTRFLPEGKCIWSEQTLVS
ncbi:ATP-binding SpoIIE family protein phosphatase [Streptomyces cinereoruber]|uniref:ATP-binding SpoIIE family protein phosphatase n=1 Tax=Streptomyces cinereoruber TaxID=67260 RepID=UPI00363AB10E